MSEALTIIQSRADAATGGPWARGAGVSPYVAKRDWVEVTNSATICHDVRPADAMFIAHARTDVPKLVAALEAVLAITRHPEGSGNVVFMASDIEQAIEESLAGAVVAL